jgi:hypothetical protein
MKIIFSDWLPDQPAVSGSLTEANNVYATQIGYAPFPSAVSIGSPAAEALTASFTGKYGPNVIMFASSLTRIYKYNTVALTYDNVSKVGNYSASVINATQFGSVVITSNGIDKLQSYSLTVPTLYGDLAAAAPAAKYVTVVRDFVVAANTTGFENKLSWSDINLETNWTPSATSQSDSQVIPDGGNIQGITGGEFGLVFLERAIYRMSYVGSPLFFQFDNISRGLGCIEPNSIVQQRHITYFLSDDGFYQCDGQNVSSIGNEKVDRYFFKDITIGNLSTISSVCDPIKKLIIWNYKNGSGNYSQLIYNWVLQKWTSASIQVSHLSEIASPTATMDTINSYGTVDSISIGFDSRYWASSKLLLSGIVGNNVAAIDGANSTASITTGDIGIDGTNSFISMARPIIDNGSSTVSVASRFKLNDGITYSTPSTANNDGRAPLGARGRYHRVRVAPTGVWANAVGIELDITPQGIR